MSTGAKEVEVMITTTTTTKITAEDVDSIGRCTGIGGCYDGSPPPSSLGKLNF